MMGRAEVAFASRKEGGRGGVGAGGCARNSASIRGIKSPRSEFKFFALSFSFAK